MPVYFDLVFDIPADQSFCYLASENGEAAVGKRALVPFGRSSKDALGFITACRGEPPAGVGRGAIKAIRRVVDKDPVFDSEAIELARWMASYYLCSTGQALSAMIPSGKRGAKYAALDGDAEGFSPAAYSLSDEQQNALSAILSPPAAPHEIRASGGSLQSKLPQMFYLFGITGSGKTEVFLRAAESVLKEGKSAIYLVPEISLTHQAAELIEKRFGAAAAALHSGMSPQARLSQWMRIKRGEARIVAGPRSAVFAPVKDLGLIIIDEEHDGSYKSGNTPRYHARQAALRRCQLSGAKLVMGSATPSAEAWKLMADGLIKRLDLSKRLGGGSLPEIEPVNLAGASGCLTAQLKEEILKSAQMGRQSVLFLNRRGFAGFYHCPTCGWQQGCRHCSVALTWHKSRGKAVCHYCGYLEPPAKACRQCGSLAAGWRNFGTEMIEEELAASFPALRIRRLDGDTAAKKGALAQTLKLFKEGQIDILLGTQMVAKGLNFPAVRLVGVVLADTGLHLPDFRAAERTFSLIVQVAGRAGRFFPDGKVIVQTLRMSDPVIKRSCALDTEGFFSGELAQRKALGFPPFSRLIRFTARAKDEKRAGRAISRLAALARPLLPPDADMLGPAECPVAVIAGNHRRHIILRGPSMGSLHAAAKGLLSVYEKGKDARVYVEVDVDPVSVL